MNREAERERGTSAVAAAHLCLDCEGLVKATATQHLQHLARQPALRPGANGPWRILTPHLQQRGQGGGSGALG